MLVKNQNLCYRITKIGVSNDIKLMLMNTWNLC